MAAMQAGHVFQGPVVSPTAVRHVRDMMALCQASAASSVLLKPRQE